MLVIVELQINTLNKPEETYNKIIIIEWFSDNLMLL